MLLVASFAEEAQNAVCDYLEKGRFQRASEDGHVGVLRPKLCFMEDNARVQKRLDQYPEPWSVSVSAVAKGLLITDARYFETRTCRPESRLSVCVMHFKDPDSLMLIG